MIRTETTLIVGEGANREIELPDGPELLARIAAGFDFDRLGSEVQSRDLVKMAEIFGKVAGELDTTQEALILAARKIRAASFVSPSIESILEQMSDDRDVAAVGKIAIVYNILQAESKSTLAREPRAEGELPLRGKDNWLYKIAQMMVTGVARKDVADCFYRLSIVAFTYDRAIEHFLPSVVAKAFGMEIEEARDLVGLHLRIVHPFGCVGQLPWQSGDKPVADWGDATPEDILSLTRMVHTFGQRAKNRQFMSYLRAEIVQAKRIAFLGHDFDPLKYGMLLDGSMDHNPELILSLGEVDEGLAASVPLVSKRAAGVTNDDLIHVHKGSAFEALSDFALLLES